MSHNKYLGTVVSQKSKGPKGTTEPVRLYKKSILLMNPDKEFCIRPLGGHVKRTGLNEPAICPSWGTGSGFLGFMDNFHQSPVKSCSCGFYAYKNQYQAANHNQWIRNGSIIFEVVASGKLLEYDEGYRYGHQRVTKLIVDRCYYCNRSANCFSSSSLKVDNEFMVTPTCWEHGNSDRRIQADNLSQMEEKIDIAMKAQYGENFPRIELVSRDESVDKNMSMLTGPYLASTESSIGGLLKKALSRFSLVARV